MCNGFTMCSTPRATPPLLKVGVSLKIFFLNFFPNEFSETAFKTLKSFSNFFSYDFVHIQLQFLQYLEHLFNFCGIKSCGINFRNTFFANFGQILAQTLYKNSVREMMKLKERIFKSLF